MICTTKYIVINNLIIRFYEFENLEELRAFDGRYKRNNGNVALELVQGL